MAIKDDVLAEGYQKTPYGYIKGVKSADGVNVDLHIARIDPDTMDRAPDEIETLHIAELQALKTRLEKQLQQTNGKINIFNQVMAAP